MKTSNQFDSNTFDPENLTLATTQECSPLNTNVVKAEESSCSLATVKVISPVTNTTEMGVVEFKCPTGTSRKLRKAPPGFVPLELETRFAVNTEIAAFHCNRRPQTLRAWSCKENGPLRSLNINGRLAWSISEIRQLFGCLASSEIKKRPEGS